MGVSVGLVSFLGDSDFIISLHRSCATVKKIGIGSHLQKKQLGMEEQDYLQKLLGRVNYVLSVDKTNSEMIGYKKWLIDQLK